MELDPTHLTTITRADTDLKLYLVTTGIIWIIRFPVGGPGLTVPVVRCKLPYFTTAMITVPGRAYE